ncbi:hypothetical protein GCM10009809_02680 [Isoptericola hypogeus]|uniref:Energy transducer TonB n=1 Tax=Isoptericola hypogeus TaxID=300179 RepID=A0ABN2IQM1_9MICO
MTTTATPARTEPAPAGAPTLPAADAPDAPGCTAARAPDAPTAPATSAAIVVPEVDAVGAPADEARTTTPDARSDRPVPRVAAAPRRSRPASYPQAAVRPRVRKVQVGAASARRPIALEDEPEERPLRDEPPAPLPDPTAQCCSVVRAALEVLRGERPAAHLARWVTPQVRDQLEERARLLREHAARGVAEGATRAGSRPALVRRVRLMRLGEDVAEATVVLDDDGRVRAAAVRLEARRGTWRVAVLEIG